MSKHGVFSSPYFPAFGLNMERYEVSLHIQSECRKMWTRKYSVFGHFSHSDSDASLSSCFFWLLTKDSRDDSDRTCFVLRIIKNYSSLLKLSYSYFLLFNFISLVRASGGDSAILFISDKDSFIDWIISREISKLGKKV